MARILRFDAAARLSGMPNAADKLRRIADALDQSSDTPAAFVHSDGEHFDPVVVHQSRGIDPSQNQGRRSVIRQHEDVAISTAANAARDTLAFACRGISVRPLD